MSGSGIPDAWQVRLKLLVEGTVTCRGRSREKVGDTGSVIIEEILIVKIVLVYKRFRILLGQLTL